MARERRTVDDLAAAILDGTPVDWDAAEMTSPGPDGELIRYLRVVAGVADAYRAGSSVEPDAPDDRTRRPLRVMRPDETWGHLRLLEHIGSGAFGEVYRAWDSKLDREVALKLLATPTADKGTTVIQEGSLLARIRHPNVVTVFGADQFDGKVGLWMELIKGRALADLLLDQGPMSAHEAAMFGTSVCRALSAVHRVGLLHRDVKAQNVMREDGGRVLLMDFGTGRLALEAPGTPAPSGLAGTPMYLAPELFVGAEPTAQSDIYSVGVLLFQLVTRTYPVHGTTLRDLRAAHDSGRRTYLRDERPDLPDAFVRVVEKAIAPDPAARFESAGAMEAALAAVVVAPETIATAPAAPLPRARPDSRRRPRARMAAVATLLVAALAAALVWRGRGREARGQGTAAGGGAGNSAPVAVPALANSVVVRKVAIPGGFSTGRPAPDGTLFSFSDETGNLAVVEMATGKIRRLTTAEPDVEYAEGSAISADGRRAGYAWQTLDGRLELRTVGTDGKRARVLLRRDDVQGASLFEWARDGNSVLCDLSDVEGAHRLVLVETQGEVRVVAALGTAAPRHASLSPDGRFVVFDGPPREDDVARDVFVVGADGAGRRALIAHPANDHSPVWTPDGSRVLFVSDRSGAMDVWAVDVADGAAVGQPKLIHRGIGRMWLLGLTDSGSYYYESIEGAMDVYTADLGSGGIQRALPLASTFAGSNMSSAWSPDGRSIAYGSRRSLVGFDRRSMTLVVRDLDTRESREHVPAVNHFMVSGWSPDGRQVLLHGFDPMGRGGLYAIDVETGRMTPLVVAPKTGESAPIGRGEWMPDADRILYLRGKALWWRDVERHADEMALDWRAEKIHGIDGGGMGRGYKASPDGSIAFSGMVGEGDTHGTALRIKTPGQPSREIFRVKRPEILVFQDWMPDGRSLLFTKAHLGRKQSLWQIPVEGGEPTPLPLGMGLRDVSVAPDGQRITFTSGAPTLEVWVLENFLQ